MQNVQSIEAFIQRFRQYGRPAKEMFLEGNCYWFAVILAKRFHAEIYYIPEAYHFVAKLGDKYYDITGNVTKQYSGYRNWAEYKQEEPKHAEYVIRELIE